MSQDDKSTRRSALRAEMEAAYQDELQSAKGTGASEADESTLRNRALAKVRSSHPEANPADLEQAAWQAGQALRSLSRS